MIPRASLFLRRQTGAYYTPSKLATILTEWAIRSPTDRVLEPSFGGGEFVFAAHRALSRLGCPDPVENVFGVDIDPYAFQHLNSSLPKSIINRNFIEGDFLMVERSSFPIESFDVIVGNPPYLGHRSITDSQKSAINRLTKNIDINISRMSSIWVYFILRSCEMLNAGGCLAFVIPRRFVDSAYTTALREFLSERFLRVQAIILEERLFEDQGTSENTTILLASDYTSARRAAKIEFSRVLKLDHLKRQIDSREEAGGTHLLETRARQLLLEKGTALKEFASIKIGLVLGDAKFFTFDLHKARAHNLDPARMRLVVNRARHLSGVSITARELRNAGLAGEAVFIIDTLADRSAEMKTYLKTKTTVSILNNTTFSKRKIWHYPFDKYVGDAFLSGMSHGSPRLVLNPDQLPCTNALYRVNFHKYVNFDLQMQLSIAMTSTFSQLSSEIEGRQYGAGLLKHEPSDALRIRVLLKEGSMKSAESTFWLVNNALKSGRYNEATHISDQFAVENSLISSSNLHYMQTILRELRSYRHRS